MSLIVIACILLLNFAFAAKTITVNVTNCTSANDEGQITQFVVSAPPHKTGQNFTITPYAFAKESLTDVAFHARCTAIGVPVLDITADACAPVYISAPPFVKLWYPGIKCPLQTNGVVSPKVIVDVEYGAPDDININTVVTLTDTTNGKEVICIDVELQLHG
eukprot:406694_1